MFCERNDYVLEKYMEEHKKEAEELISIHIKNEKVRKAFIELFRVTYGFDEANPLINFMNLNEVHLAALEGDLDNYELNLKDYFEQQE